MRRIMMGLTAAALIIPAPANAAVKPKTGTWKGQHSLREYVHLKVAKKGARRVVTLYKYEDTSPHPHGGSCIVTAVGGWLGESGRALKVDRSGRFRGSFGSFMSGGPFGRRSVVVDSGRFSSSGKGKVTITANLDGPGIGGGCPKTTTFTIRR